MGKITRAFNWSDTDLGSPSHWPVSLRTTLTNVLNSAFPMFLFWGPDLICFYNDAFRPSLGVEGKHPAVGEKGKKVWVEIWDFIGPLLEKVMTTGEPVWMEDSLVPFYRNGKLEDIYWTFSYSPAYGDEGTIEGVLVTCVETTQRFLNLKKLGESEDSLRFAIEATELGTWDYKPQSNLITGNQRLKEWFGLPREGDISLQVAIDVINEQDRERVSTAINEALQYDSGGSYDIEYSITNPKTGRERFVRAKGRAWFGADKICYRFNGTLQDITEQVLVKKKMEETAQQLRSVIESAPFPIAVYIGKEMKIVLANQSLMDTWGKGNNIIGKLYGDVLPEIKGSYIYNQLEKVYETGIAFNAKNTQVDLFVDGRLQTFYFNFSFTPLFDAEGKVYGVMNTGADVTDLILAKQKAEESEKRFQNLIRSASVGMIVLFGEEMVVTVVNAAYGRLINRTVDELMNKPLFSLVPETEELFRPILDKVRLTGEPVFLYDAPYSVSANNEKIEGYLNLIYQPYKEADGRITGVMALCHDVTEQVHARQKLFEADERARLAIAAGDLGTVEVNLQTNELVVSEKMETIFGIEPGSDRSKYISAIHPDDLPGRAKAYEKAFRDGLLEYEARVLKKNNVTTWIRAKGRVLFDEEGKPLKLVTVVQDITKEKSFAEELTRQVKERTLELEEFTFVSHHDLQEPLRKIIMFTDMVRFDSQNVFSLASKNRLEKVTNSARRMSIALRDVLNFTSLDKKESFVATDLDEVLAAVQNDLELVISEKNAKIQSDQLPTIYAVSQQMHQLFYNLVNNALKFARADVPLLITISCNTLTNDEKLLHPELKPNQTYFHIAVSDNGIGFDQSSAEKIFVLFQRLHSKDSYAGTGIGLALCKKVVNNHEGKIWATGDKNHGATFNIFLPAALQTF